MLLFRTICAATVFTMASGLPVQAATIVVAAGGKLQTALDTASPGDVITLAAGATFTGNFTLPVKSGTGVITVRSSAPDSALPGPGVRMTPAYAALLPKIVSTNSLAALRTLPGAHHWRLQFLEFPWTMLGYGEMVRIGEGGAPQTTLAQVPYEIEVDRVYVHGSPLYGQKRGIALNGRNVTIRNSYISEIKAVGFDAQAIAGWNGPGPFTIENNYLEASGENFLLGGSDPAIPGMVTEYLVFRYNYVTKPLSWREPVIRAPLSVVASATAGGGTLAAGVYRYRVYARRPVGGGTVGMSEASVEVTATLNALGKVSVSWGAVPDATEYRLYGRNKFWTMTVRSFTDTGSGGTAGAVPALRGDTWQVKNLFELKNARHSLIEYNVFENNWLNAQKGYAILFTPRNQDGACTWCVVEDVTFQYNLVRNVAGAISVLGYDAPNVSGQTNNVTIRHNLLYGITTGLGGTGWFLLIGDKPRDVVVDHNTIDFDGTTAVYAYGGSASVPATITGFRFTNNALRHNLYGINGASSSSGNAALAAYFPGSTVQKNWFQGGTASRYPAGNLFSGTFAAAFMDSATGDYRVSVSSVLIGAGTDGTNIGADISTLTAGITLAGGSTMPNMLSRPAGLRLVR
jgi:hypothetical protein